MIFNQKIIDIHWQRAKNNFEQHNYLYNSICDDLFDNLMDLTNFKPKTFVDLSNKNNYLTQKIITQFNCENKIEMSQKIDLIVAPMLLHSINNPVEELKNIASHLNKNGVFIGTFFGGKTLQELRESFIAIESQNRFFYPHVVPMVDIKDAGKIMQLAGFSDIIVHSDIINIKYKNCQNLMRSLKYMGENNPLAKQNKGFYSKNILQKVLEYHDKKFNSTTFDVVYCFGSI
jgi:hypothetical protein